MKISIVIPAHNEEQRLGRTLQTYAEFFSEKKNAHIIDDFEIVTVLNGCSDNTYDVACKHAQIHSEITVIQYQQAGKGFAIAQGFAHALNGPADLIGFVDADMATRPEYFFQLIEHIPSHDGIIASRYMKGAQVTPARPLIKRMGSKLVYENLAWLLFGIRYQDFQCGAKLFKREVIQTIVDKLTVAQWAFDVELLYLCKKHKAHIKEIPTIWHDQADSKLKLLKGGLRMLSSLVKLRLVHSPFKQFFIKKQSTSLRP